MKRFLLVALLLVSAASAYAADLKITGDAEVRGFWANMAYDGDPVQDDKYFDADFNFFATLAITENTSVVTKLTFDAQQDGTAFVPDSEAADAFTMLGVERAYISTKFLPALTVDAGLLGGGAWGTDFGNTEINVTRIKATYAVSEDIKVMAIYEKYVESNEATFEAAGGEAGVRAALADLGVGAGALQDAIWNEFDLGKTDAGDTTSYFLEASIKTAGITILPLVKYQTLDTEVWLNNRVIQAVIDEGTLAGAVEKSDAAPYLWSVDVAATGDLGMAGFEAEFIYIKQNGDDFLADLTKYGAYVNVFAKTEMAKAGVAAFYESADDTDGSFAAGEDFDFTTVAVDLVLENVTGMMAAKLYADDIKLVDKISADVAFAYGMQTDKDVDVTDLGSEIAFWEVDAAVKYAIDAATTYSIEGGYANIDTSDKAFTVYEVYQKIAVKF